MALTLEPGLSAAFRYTVTEADTAAALGSPGGPMLATSRELALTEQATTVGVRVELDYLAPSRVGAELEIEAVLEGSMVGAWSSPCACAMPNGRWPAA